MIDSVGVRWPSVDVARSTLTSFRYPARIPTSGLRVESRVNDSGAMSTSTFAFTMKLSILLVSLSVCQGFSPLGWSRRQPSTTKIFTLTTGNDFGSAMPETQDIYERLGVPEDKLAIGINPEELLEHVGT